MSGVGQRTAELAVMTLTASRLFRGLSAIVGATYREFRSSDRSPVTTLRSETESLIPQCRHGLYTGCAASRNQ